MLFNSSESNTVALNSLNGIGHLDALQFTKQKKIIEDLELENSKIRGEIARLTGSSFVYDHNMSIISIENEILQVDNLTKEEKKLENTLIARIKEADQSIISLKKGMGSSSYVADKEANIQNQIKIIENRLDLSTCKLDSTLEINKKIREKINHLKEEKCYFSVFTLS